MKIRPVILCGGAGTRLWSTKRNNQAKQFIDFGNWTLFGKTLDRIKSTVFDTPIISTNKKYLNIVKYHLKKKNIKKYKIILEPFKKNTSPAILSTTLLEDIPNEQPLIFFSADHLIEKVKVFNNLISRNKKNLTGQNIFIFGIKPTSPSIEYGYFLTTKISGNINRVTKFIEKPTEVNAKKIIRKKGIWNSGIFLLRKDSIIYNFKKYQKLIYRNCFNAVRNAKTKNNIYHLNKSSFIKSPNKSFDKAILEKTRKINSIKLNIPWSDLGSWKEILKIYDKHKNKYIRKKNIYYRPWGKYTNLFKGKKFLIKEIFIKPKGILSLQKHNHRSEHWLITMGKPVITLNNERFIKKPFEHIFIPKKAVHRIQNSSKTPIKILEAQIGSLLKETDIIRYSDIYGRVK